MNEFISKSKNQKDTSLWNLEDMSKSGMRPIEDLMQPLVSEIQLAGKWRFPNTVQTNWWMTNSHGPLKETIKTTLKRTPERVSLISLANSMGLCWQQNVVWVWLLAQFLCAVSSDKGLLNRAPLRGVPHPFPTAIGGFLEIRNLSAQHAYVIATSHESLPCFARALLTSYASRQLLCHLCLVPSTAHYMQWLTLPERITAMGVLQGLKHLSGIVGTGSGGGCRERN